MCVPFTATSDLAALFIANRRECVECPDLVLEAKEPNGSPITLEVEPESELGRKQYALSVKDGELIATFIDRHDLSIRESRGLRPGHLKHKHGRAS